MSPYHAPWKSPGSPLLFTTQLLCAFYLLATFFSPTIYDWLPPAVFIVASLFFYRRLSAQSVAQPHLTPNSPLPKPFVLSALWLLFLGLQIVPLPGLLVEQISEASYNLRDYLYGSSWTAHSITLDSAASVNFLLHTSALTTLFFLLTLQIERSDQLSMLLLMLWLCSILCLLFTLWQYHDGFPLSRHAIPAIDPNLSDYHSIRERLQLITLTSLTSCSILFLHSPSGRYYPNIKIRIKGYIDSLYGLRPWIWLSLISTLAALFYYQSFDNLCLLTAAIMGTLLAQNLIQKKQGLFISGWLAMGTIGVLVVATFNTPPPWPGSWQIVEDYLMTGAGTNVADALIPLYKTSYFEPHGYQLSGLSYLLVEQGIFGFGLLLSAIGFLTWQVLQRIKSARKKALSGLYFLSISATLLYTGQLLFSPQAYNLSSSAALVFFLASGHAAVIVSQKKKKKEVVTDNFSFDQNINKPTVSTRKKHREKRP